jgi:RHS repeat-associated protein
VTKESFTYDWMGNTLTADDDKHLSDRSPGAITNDTVHPHQLVSAIQGGTTTVPSYDWAGNMTLIEITRNGPCTTPCPARYEYFWDEVGRLSKARRSDAVGSQISPAVTVSYAYDGAGARVLKSTKNERTGAVAHTAAIFDTLSLDQAAFPDAGGDYEQTARTERVYLASGAGLLGRVQHVAPDIPSGTSGQTRVFFALGDQLGSTAFVIDKETGELVERATYEAFGASESDYRPDRWGNFREDHRYTGHLDDIQIGLVYFGARYYAPSLGRWVSPDPLAVHAMAGDMNAYAFVRGSPMRLVDPIGLDDCDASSTTCPLEVISSDPDPGPVCSGDCGGGRGRGGGGGGGGGASRGGGTPSARPAPPPDPGVPVSAVAVSPTLEQIFYAEPTLGEQIEQKIGAAVVAFVFDDPVLKFIHGLPWDNRSLGERYDSALAALVAEDAEQRASGIPKVLGGTLFPTMPIAVLEALEVESASAGLITKFDRASFNFTKTEKLLYQAPVGTLCPSCQANPVAQGGAFDSSSSNAIGS